MDRLRLPSTLEGCQRVLVSGAGGGFDVYAGLPIYARLRAEGKTVFLANLSFAQLQATTAKQIRPALFEVHDNTHGERSYFPERSLARFLSQRFQEAATVYAFDNVGVQPVQAAYEHLLRPWRLMQMS